VQVSLEPAARQLLKVGTNTEVNFQVGQLNNAILVPSAAIVRQQNGTGVYIMSQDKKPVFKAIEIGTTVDEQTEVKSGLRNKDQVLISFPPGMEPEVRAPGPIGDLMNNKNRNGKNSSLRPNAAPPSAP
jgi:HlyD family secretion protein